MSRRPQFTPHTFTLALHRLDEAARQLPEFKAAYRAAVDATVSAYLEHRDTFRGFTEEARQAFLAAVEGVTIPGPFGATHPLSVVLSPFDLASIRDEAKSVILARQRATLGGGQ